jgi:hypothetical protein
MPSSCTAVQLLSGKLLKLLQCVHPKGFSDVIIPQAK